AGLRVDLSGFRCRVAARRDERIAQRDPEDEFLLGTLATGGKQLELSERKCEVLDRLTVPAPGEGLLGSKPRRGNRPPGVASADVVRRQLGCDLSGPVA